MTLNDELSAFHRPMRGVRAMPMDLALNLGHPHAPRRFTDLACVENPHAGVERWLRGLPDGATR